MEWLKAIQWDHPAIVAAVGGMFLIAAALLKRKKPSDGGAASVTTTVSPEISVAPQTKIENKPSNVFKPTIGLDEKAVGRELNKAVDPIRQKIEALSEQVAQLAPKEPVPDSGDPLKIKAIEFRNAGFDAYGEDKIDRAIGHWLDAVGLDPDSPSVHYILGLTLAAKGEHHAAIEHIGKAMGIEPDAAHDHFVLGCVLAEKEHAAPAVAALARAIQLDPHYRDKAKTDTHYDPIRDAPAFRKLVYGE